MSNYETIQRKRNITVGIFVLLALCSLGWLVFKFGDLPTVVSEIRSFQVFVQFPSAPGVQKDTPVRFCGYQIGRVTAVMAPEIRKDLNTGLRYHQTLVVLSIDKKYVNIPSNVEVKLMTRGLGSSYIELKIDPTGPLVQRDPNRPETKFLVDKMPLQGSTGMTSEFFPEESQEKLDQLANSLDSLMKNANEILGDEANKENFRITLANLSKASKQATEALTELQKLSVTSRNTAEELGKAAAQLRVTLEKINDGEGTAGKFINDGRLYEDLLENTQQLDILIRDLKKFIAESRKKGLKLKW